MIHWYCSSSDGPRRGFPSINPAAALLIAVMVLSVIGLIPSRTVPENAAQADNAASVLLRRDCQVLQQLTYEPCGHTLTRREALPTDLIGKTRPDLEAYYDSWRVTSFSASEVQMQQQLSIHCPQHTVLKPDESGMLCIWQNIYGDALNLVRELDTPLSDLPDEAQEQLRFGMGFDTLEALTQWLESAES